ncbi:hypothetical protein SKAU_G00152480 [Synaphobranchus kaupii]|uniref:Uncharacterized protein n=1 Tax=Synaphobranchus kaupii TaxID=118154 RepID=A0A9Q1FH19_SYNKA|nr:hypothetical protein SKAU_G00152480 [Synaphobranchus kaupii]
MVTCRANTGEHCGHMYMDRGLQQCVSVGLFLEGLRGACSCVCVWRCECGASSAGVFGE